MAKIKRKNLNSLDVFDKIETEILIGMGLNSLITRRKKINFLIKQKLKKKK